MLRQRPAQWQAETVNSKRDLPLAGESRLLYLEGVD